MFLNSAAHRISHAIENQFPAIYREEAQELIRLVEAYYQFLETSENQSVYNTRHMRDFMDIDKTMQSMLMFYHNKFMKGFPLNENNARFIIKNILDLYRRKGTKEGISLFFRLFYNQEVDVTYPSENIIKPSSSRWKTGSFLQMNANERPTYFSDIIGRKIYGSLSKAEAYVDNVQFVSIYGAFVPILFLDRVRGRFLGLENVFSTEPSRKNYGRTYGSMDRVINIRGSSVNNRIGDSIDITAGRGTSGKGIITGITNIVSGQITFDLADGDFGYSLGSNTTIVISNQNLLFDNTDLPFIIGEKIRQPKDTTYVYGTVIGQDTSTVGIKLDNSVIGFTTGQFETIERDQNIQRIIVYATIQTPDAKSARVEAVAIDNQTNINIVVDIISDFLNVPLNAVNYSVSPALKPMSGGAANINSPLNQAFGPVPITIGSISKLGNIYPGEDYTNNVFVLAKEDQIIRLNIHDQILTMNNITVPIFEGDFLSQQRSIINFAGATELVTCAGKIVKIIGENLFVKLRSYYGFNLGTPIYKQNSNTAIDVISITRQNDSRSMGSNALIIGNADFELGRITDVKVINSGIGYEHNKPVAIHNRSLGNENDAVGIALTRGQGISEGRWITKTSHIGVTSGKVIQDSDYYQDYSYEIATSLTEAEFIEEFKDVIHPSGTKVFTKFSLFEDINMNIEVFAEIESEII